ncbi:hypothetical protein QW060_24760 [Myroides ceti]|uniref:Uncharacterized protein n=1 Tax=Paenimyroides ceti TaxID=395087 RepID=A0ABT8CZY9_9FLAO|nr:hypothetical protein [Paenimyroides ceti]MDN3710104.1 hypothetical protein [Paenimyroides ceti]
MIVIRYCFIVRLRNWQMRFWLPGGHLFFEINQYLANENISAV